GRAVERERRPFVEYYVTSWIRDGCKDIAIIGRSDRKCGNYPYSAQLKALRLQFRASALEHTDRPWIRNYAGSPQSHIDLRDSKQLRRHRRRAEHKSRGCTYHRFKTEFMRPHGPTFLQSNQREASISGRQKVLRHWSACRSSHLSSTTSLGSEAGGEDF